MPDEAGVGGGISTNSLAVAMIYAAMELTKTARNTDAKQIATDYKIIYQAVLEAYQRK